MLNPTLACWVSQPKLHYITYDIIRFVWIKVAKTDMSSFGNAVAVSILTGLSLIQVNNSDVFKSFE